MSNIKTLRFFLAAGLLLMTFAGSSLAVPSRPTTAPPIEQTLVREGDFALGLVERLGIGEATSEAEAESMLSSLDIAPRNGWIADYPMTPDIIAELRDAVAAAADSNRLPMTHDEATKRFTDLTVELGLPIVPSADGAYASERPAQEDSGQYPDPTEINDYYDEEGPPVVTYYPPPPDYGYLYSWVPCPFWGWGLSFSGFFILHDFHRFHKVVVVKKHGSRISFNRVSNHVVDPSTRNVVVIDPAKRAMGRNFHADTNRGRGSALSSTEARSGAQSIVNRGLERGGSSGPSRANDKGRAFGEKALSSGSSNQSRERDSGRRGSDGSSVRSHLGEVNRQTENESGGGRNPNVNRSAPAENRSFSRTERSGSREPINAERFSTPERGMDSSRMPTPPREFRGGSSGDSNSFEGRAPMNSGGSSSGEGRSFSAPSFRGGSDGGGFRGSRGGGGGGMHSGRGGSSGGGGGGCRGRC